MPQKLKHPCNKPGCPELTTDPYCPAHAKQKQQAYDSRRGTAAERGYGARWQARRLTFLKKYPLCRHCEGEDQLKGATVVDHIIPHKGDKVLFWDELNWQPLCKRHHDIKTAAEDGGFGR